MKKSTKIQIIEFIFIGALGSLLHFTYELTDKNYYVGLFSAINESTWEHLKLLFFPCLIFNIFYLFKAERKSAFISSKTLGTLCGMLFITSFFFTYTGILGYNIMFLDLSSFFIGALITVYVGNKLYNKNIISSNIYAIFFTIINVYFIISFIIYTYAPPKIGIFLDYIPLLKIYPFNSK